MMLLRSTPHTGRQTIAAETGFSLIELMIAITIFGIIAAFAYPNYGDYMQRGRLVDASTDLATLAIRIEQQFLETRRYTNDAGQCAMPAIDNTEYFTFDCVIADNNLNNFSLRASSTDRLGDGTTVRYTINQTGNRATEYLRNNNVINSVNCWASNFEGDCP